MTVQTMGFGEPEKGTSIVFMNGDSLFVPDRYRKTYSVYGYEFEEDLQKQVVLLPWHTIKRITTNL